MVVEIRNRWLRAPRAPEALGRYTSNILSVLSKASLTGSGDEPHAVGISDSSVVDAAISFVSGAGACNVVLNARQVLGRCTC